MIKYIIIEQSLFTAHSKLKNYKLSDDAKYIEDALETLRRLKFKNDNKEYYLLKWDDAKGKPEGILPRYSDNGNNPKVNKIMSEQEIKNYINEHIEPTEI